jgi:xanthine dehydrogenase molybdenum-binding subunit
MKVKIRQGCDAEGRLTFRDISLLLDNGAYTSWGATTPNVALLPATSLYRVPNARFNASSVYTNNTYSQAMRGYGTPQVTFALESSMEELAEQAGIDSYEFRLKNANVAGETTVQGALAHTCGHKECLEQVAALLDWPNKHGRKSGDRVTVRGDGVTVRGDGVKVRGVGMACLMHVGGGANIYKSDGCATYLKMDDHGYVDVYSGSQDIGQGLDTVLRQIVAEVLGISTTVIKVHVGDTDVCGWDAGCHASRSTFIAGNSALMAATEVRDRILAFAAQFLGVPIDSLELRDGMVRCALDPSKDIKLDKLGRRAHFGGGTMFSASVFFEPESVPLDRDLKGNNSLAYTWGCHGVEVEVDTKTGQVEIVDYIAAHDVGRAINPLLLDGQVYGAILQGVGYALSEELVYDHGRLMNPNFRDYKVLTALDAVPVRRPLVIETLDPEGPFGAKGVGEPGLVPVAPAIANAVYDAVGVRMRRLPLKADLILEEILKERSRAGSESPDEG